MSTYIIEKIKKNGEPFSVRTFVSRYKSYQREWYTTTTLNKAKVYKSIGGIRQRIRSIELKENGNINLAITEIDNNGEIMPGTLSISLVPKKKKKRKKRITTRWQMMDID